MNKKYKPCPGVPYPLGAIYNGNGVNFALFSENATGVELCLFDDNNNEEKIKVIERTHNSWHIFIPGIKPGQLYGYRVHGDYNPEEGFRFNPNKLLVDPYATAIDGCINWNDTLYGYDMHSEDEDLSFSESNSADYIPKAVVTNRNFDWQGDELLNIPMHKTIIYELHVKGFSHLAKHIPKEMRGTYAGVAHPDSIQYFHSLGINALELMPIHHFVADRMLVDQGLTNYWGYNTLGFFAPHSPYSSSGSKGSQVNEFKKMVKALHKAGIEVILDVVYNHTAEGNRLGPTLSFRGIDNTCYYRLEPGDKQYYTDYTGTGNTVNSTHPAILRLIMDSLRYWVNEMHVDGFRFDLAPALARDFDDMNKRSSFFDILHQDPILSQVKLIAEPWDLGQNGFQVGNFPSGWMEWNAKYRDSMKKFWRGDDEMLPEFANRLTGSSDLYFDNWRTPVASINYIASHDGFTLKDLVSYNKKHNKANGENNQDGENNNFSWNHGVEGPTNNKKIKHLREKQIRNFLVTLFLSQGVPMLRAGDELGKSQKGNNNPYCQDNEISWINWNEKDEDLLDFTTKLIYFRKKHPVFCRRKWFKYQPIKGKGVYDIEWFHHTGEPMSNEQWESAKAKSLGVFLSGDGIRSQSENGKKIKDDNFYMIFNSNNKKIPFTMPGENWGKSWGIVFDTTSHCFFPWGSDKTLIHGETLQVVARSAILLINKKKK